MARNFMTRKVILFACFAMMTSFAIGNVSYESFSDSKDGGDGDDNPWDGKERGLQQNISITYQSPFVIVANATSEDDITAKIVDFNSNVLHSVIIAADDTSYFTIYVGGLSAGTYQLVLCVDGIDYLFWPFVIN